MGTNYYRIPTHDEMLKKKELLILHITHLDLSPMKIESGFRIIPNKTGTYEWDTQTPWDTFMEDVNIHLGKRSHGWKFCWNFHNDKYYSNKEDLLTFIRSGRVVDEYGSEIDNEEFIKMSLEWGQPDGQIVNDEYRKKERARGHGMYWLDSEKYDDLLIDGLRVSNSTEFS